MNFLIAVLIGLVFGLISGLVPGLHPNFLAAILFTRFSEWWLLPTIVTMLVSSQFFEYIRATFLFVPEESTVLAMHPIFKFVSEGKALAAVKLCIVGVVASILVGIILSPLLIKIVPIAYQFMRPYIPFALLFIAGYLIFRDKKPFAAFGVFLLAGVIGYFGLKMLNQPLLILLTGFFGFPILLQIKTKIPEQIKSHKYPIEKRSIANGIAAALVSSLVLTFVPAVGPSQASLFSRGLLKKTEDFLISIGAISGFDIVFSLILLFSIGKARIGTLEMLGAKFAFDLNMLILTLCLSLAVAVISYFITLKLGLSFSKIAEKLNYRYVAIVVAAFIIAIALYFDSFLGILFLVASIAVGVLANKLRTNLSHCMGSLVIPTLLYYFI